MANQINKAINTVYLTNQFDRFKYLDGNRAVSDGRVAKIKQSIQEIGYIPIPAVVNEKMEIIDGQGRIAACKELNIPTAYIVMKGLALKECIRLNINQYNWKVPDFINSYASTGDLSYQLLQALVREYKDSFGVGSIIFAVHKFDEGKGNGVVTTGKFCCTEKEYNHARVLLGKTKERREIIRETLDSSKLNQASIQALMIFLDSPSVNLQKLDNKLSNLKYQEKILTFVSSSTVDSALRSMDKLYNASSRRESWVDVEREYDEYRYNYKKEH